MKDENRSKEDLISELEVLRKKVSVPSLNSVQKGIKDKIIEHLSDLIFIIDIEGIITDYHVGNVELYSPGNLRGLSLKDTVPPEISKAVIPLIKKVIDTDQLQTFSYEMKMSGGTRYYKSTIKKSGSDEVICFVRDETTHKITTEKLEFMKGQLSDSQHISKIGSWELDLTTNQEIWSNELYSIFGVDKDAFKPTKDNYRNFIHPDDLHIVTQDHYRNYKHNDTYRFEYRIIDQTTKKIKHVQTTEKVYFGPNGKPAKLTGSTYDVTEQKKVSHLLEETEKNYKRLIDNSPDLIYRIDQTGRILFLSPSVKKLSGYTVEELTGVKISEEVYLKQEDHDEFLAELKKNGQVKNFENQLIRKNGSIWWGSSNSYSIKDQEGNITCVEGIIRDITSQKESQKELEKIRILLDQSNDSIFIIEPGNLTILYVNQKAYQNRGYTEEEILKLNVKDISIVELGGFEKDSKILEQKRHLVIERKHRRKDGSLFPVEISLKLVDLENKDYIVAVIRDITERKNFEKQLRQSQKMEAVGVLTGGIAHEFNNLLSPILGFTELLKRRKSKDDPDLKNLEQIKTAGDRAKNLIQKMLAFGRQSQSEKETVYLNNLVHESLKLIRNFFPTNIQIVEHLDKDLPPVHVMSNEIGQIIINLCVNASHAMPKGGVLKIYTKHEGLRNFMTTENKEIEGEFVSLSINDNGTGIDKKVIDKIFDPFFTTKDVGKGSGLGLSMAQGIVDQHNGYIEVESLLDSGSTFCIYLPVTKREMKP